MKLLLITVLISGYFVFLGCSPANPNYNDDVDKINNSDIIEAISIANSWRLTKPDITSFVNNNNLVVSFPDGRIIKKSLPEDSMYIAVAPYINTTHTCSTHYISSCQGELVEKTFLVRAKDDDGNILFDNEIKTLDNGFFELWLPRGLSIQLNISYNNLSATQMIATFEDSKTCVTTAKLE